MATTPISPQPAAPTPVAARPAATAPKTVAKSKVAKSGKPFAKKDLVKFYRGMASMLRAQINTGDALRYYAHGLPNKDLASTLLEIEKYVGAGMAVHEAFRKTNRFDSMTIGLIQAGADSGQLDHAFRSLSKRIQTEIYFRSKIRKAVAIPIIVINLLIFAWIMSQTKVVPQVEAMLKDVGMDPDPFTVVMFKISHITQSVWPFVVLSLIALAIVVWKSQNIRNAILNLAMAQWRLLRQLIMGMRQLTMLGTLHMLHSNGINLAKAIRVAAESVRTTPLYDELREASDRYQNAGLPVSEAFRKFTSCDPQVGHMLSIGERTASIDSQLELLAQMYEEDTDSYMEDFTQVLNFLVLIIAVLLIAAVFIGTFMPIFLMGPRMMKGAL